MKERPILFSGPMVKAILEGRKTQTRRPLKSQPFAAWMFGGCPRVCWHENQMPCYEPIKCPFGEPGDRLWVRETWIPAPHLNAKIIYRADPLDSLSGWKWSPSIHMPRWASRITLEITEVRIERVQDLTEADSVAEGLSSVAEFSNAWSYHYQNWSDNPWVWVVNFKKIC